MRALWTAWIDLGIYQYFILIITNFSMFRWNNYYFMSTFR